MEARLLRDFRGCGETAHNNPLPVDFLSFQRHRHASGTAAAARQLVALERHDATLVVVNVLLSGSDVGGIENREAVLT